MPPAVKKAPATATAPKKKPVKVNQRSFKTNLTGLDKAGYGVIIVRTREPKRAIDELKNYTFARKNRETGEFDSKFRVWDCVRGWVEFPVEIQFENNALRLEEKNPIVFSAETDITAALCQVQDVHNFGKEAWPAGIFVFNYPHFAIKDNAEFITVLKEYCHTLPTGRGRVVLVVPEGYGMPSELEDDLTILDFSVPNQEELTERYLELMGDLGKKPFDKSGVAAIVSAGLGMTALDFDQSLTLAIAENAEGGDVTKPITASIDEFLEVIYRCKMEAVKRTNVLELVDSLSMDDIAGMGNVKEWVASRRDWLTPEAREFGLKAPRGSLVVGVQGTGKSLIPRGIASVFGVPCIRMDLGKVFGKYVGESEGRMDTSLSFIEAISPCVVWVDEIDKAGLTADSANESSKRVLQKLLTFMQEAADGIFWNFTCNRMAGIPPELVRPGRVDVTFGVVLPNAEERKAVFEIHLRKRKQNFAAVKNIDVAVQASEHYTPAEIEMAVNNAVGYAFTNKTAITGEVLAQQIKYIKPQSISHKKDMDEIIRWCNDNALPASLTTAKAENLAVAPSKLNLKRRIG